MRFLYCPKFAAVDKVLKCLDRVLFVRLEEAQKLDDSRRCPRRLTSSATWNVSIFAVRLIIDSVSDSIDVGYLNEALAANALSLQSDILERSDFLSHDSAHGFVDISITLCVNFFI